MKLLLLPFCILYVTKAVKIFLISMFSYLHFRNHTQKSENETANMCGTTNSKPSEPIIIKISRT